MTRKEFLSNLQKIGYSLSNAYTIVNGTRSITRAVMKKAKDDFGIPYDYWDALPFKPKTNQPNTAMRIVTGKQIGRAHV